MKSIFSKGSSRNIQSGLPKGQAIVVAFIITIMGYFVIRGIADEWIKPETFFLVWLMFFIMIYNGSLDKPSDLYEYKISNKDFLDEDDLLSYLQKEGMEGWSLIAAKPDQEVNERYRLMFKRKFYFKSVNGK